MTSRLAVVFVALIASPGLAQPADWPIVVSKGHFVLPLPLSLELAEGTFQPVKDEGREFLMVSDEDFSVVSQPKGYRRSDTGSGGIPGATILIRIESGEPGTYAELGADLSMPSDELQQLDTELRTGFIQEGEARGELSDVDWAGTEVVQLEGTQAIRFRYTANVEPSSSRMAVNTYLVQNNDSMYYISLSYLAEEQAMWVEDLTTAMGAMRFEARK